MPTASYIAIVGGVITGVSISRRGNKVVVSERLLSILNNKPLSIISQHRILLQSRSQHIGIELRREKHQSPCDDSSDVVGYRWKMVWPGSNLHMLE